MHKRPTPARLRRAANAVAFGVLALIGWAVMLAPLVMGWLR